jgi:hypothetical protein
LAQVAATLKAKWLASGAQHRERDLERFPELKILPAEQLHSYYTKIRTNGEADWAGTIIIHLLPLLQTRLLR